MVLAVSWVLGAGYVAGHMNSDYISDNLVHSM